MSKHLQKLFALVLVCCAFLGSSNAWGQVQYEPFPTTGNLTSTTGWSNNSGTSGFIQVISGNLTVSGLPASEGNKVAIKSTDAEDGKLALTQNVTSGSIYASFLMKPESGFLANNTAGNYFIHFIGPSATTFISRVSIRAGSAANTFNIGAINYSGGTIAPEAVFGTSPADHPTGVTYFIVFKYDMTENKTSVWVNPVPGNTEGEPTLTNTLNNPNASQITGLGIRQSNSGGLGTGNIEIDEIRIGTTWASVTPTGTPTTTPTLTPSTGSINLGDHVVDATAKSSYSLNAENLQAGSNVVITATEPFTLSTSENGTFTSTLTLSAEELATSKTIYVQVIPAAFGETTGEITHEATGATTAKVGLVVFGSSPYAQDFNRCSDALPGGWSQYSVTGAQTWACTTFGTNDPATGKMSNAVQMSGHDGTKSNDNTDWLISPKLDLAGLDIPLVNFNYRTKYPGNALKVMVSTNYTGTGDPTAATWTELATLDADNADEWKLLENLGLQDYKSTSTYIAFVYTSTAEAGARWTLDNFELEGVDNFLTTSNLVLNFPETASGSKSAAQEFTFSAVGYTTEVVVAAPANFELSKDGTTYSSSLTYTSTEAAANNKVYVRFAPAATAHLSTGPITFTGSSEAAVTRGMLSGSSMLKSTTLDVVTWNLEWFGSAGNGPDDEALQFENAKKVITELNADIIGVQEIVDEAKIEELATATGYTYVSETMSWQDGADQKVGFLYKPSVVTVKKEKVLLSKLFSDIKNNGVTLDGYPNDRSDFLWSSGRLPYMVEFEATINGVKQTLNVVNLHAKANEDTDMFPYNRRKYDVKVLKDSLDAQYANANLIILGDYNDDVDASVVGTNPSTFEPFVLDTDNFETLTYELSVAGKNTYESGSFKSFLDHIIISKELSDEYVSSSIAIEEQLLSSVANFRTTTSDHLPVSARFILTADPASISFTSASVSKTEDAGAFTVSLTLSGAVPTEQTVTITPASSSTATAADYTLTGASNGSVTVTIPANATTGTFEVNITDDTDVEEAEQVVFEISNPSSGILLGSAKTFTLTIEANDAPTGIADGTKGQFSIYPNPVNANNVRLLLPERVAATAKVTMVVYSSEGRKVMNITGTQDAVQAKLSNRIANLPAGIYMILIETGKEFFQTKMVKN